MNALQVSTQELRFTYNNKTHLQTTLTLKNNSDKHFYFKFKVTRPKYYLIKPDHGFCDTKTSINVVITLHQQGLKQAESDKVKLFYKFVGREHMEPTRGWEKQEAQTSSIRFPITIQSLPEEYKRQGERGKTSEVKSLTNSKFDQARISSTQAIAIESIKQKESRLSDLQEEIKLIKKEAKLKKGVQGIGSHLFFGGVGFLIGVLASFWL